jgi:phage tail sheath protein FI
MPEYLAPKVYVEETSFRSKSIEGVGTTTTGFVGPTRWGPLDLPLGVLTSLGDFKQVYGDGGQLTFGSSTLHNYVWHAARAFFTEGGSKLYLSRIFRRTDGQPNGFDDLNLSVARPPYSDGHGRIRLASAVGQSMLVRARWPGAAGNVRVRLTLTAGPNVLSFDGTTPRLAGVSPLDVVLVTVPASPGPASTRFGRALWNLATQAWSFQTGGSPPNEIRLADLTKASNPTVQIVTASMAVFPPDGGLPDTWTGVPLDPAHQTNGANDGLTFTFGWDPVTPERGANLPIVLDPDDGVQTGLDVLQAFFGAANAPSELRANLADPTKADAARQFDVTLQGGNDGLLPLPSDYEGEADPGTTSKTGLKQFEDIDEIAIVAAPGSSFNYAARVDDADAIIGLLLTHASAMRYRIAVVDCGNGQSVSDVKAMRGKFDSTYGALYYPWVRVDDPITRQVITLPPSGFVAGIYARNDVTRAVFKAPANEVVNLAIGFETPINTAQQEVLNPLGVNCFRFFEGRGYRLWGARTMTSDPEWKYVNLRRYFAYLEHSIDKGTQWAVFEPNGPLLWGNVRRTIEDFLLNEFQNGALLGDRPETSYFVRCDRTTMTQADLDNGRLVCLVGVAPLRPAEFVIFRIGQWTADRKA